MATSLRPLLATASRRNIHVRVPLPYKIEDGMGHFLPPAERSRSFLLLRWGLGTDEIFGTAPHERKTLAFNYARFTLNNSFFHHHLKPLTAWQNHESALIDKPLNPERTQTLVSVIATQLSSLADLKTYVAAAAEGLNSGGGVGGFVWLVTDALGRLGHRRDLRRRNAPRRRGQAVPARRRLPVRYTPVVVVVVRPYAPRGARTGVCAIHERTRVSGSVRPPLMFGDVGGVAGSNGTYDASEVPAALDALGKTLYPLFCASVHERAWMAAGYGVWGMETYPERFWTCLD
ncbi:hypothetical protein EDB86DRAFT_3076918 [Lactarius hatsudake]|nr:hypothetical protein EDB86DRAFT_3076918 [Lactarius hatsudake]